MKWNLWNPRSTSMLLMAIACTLGGSLQAAEQRHSETRRHPRAMAALDADKDGTPSESEMDRPGKALKEQDQDGDELRRGRESRRPANQRDSDRPQLRRQGRPDGGDTADRPNQGGRRHRNRDGGNDVRDERRRGPGGENRDAMSPDRPEREHRRDGLRRQGGGDRPGAELRRHDGGSPKRGERQDGELKRGHRQEGAPSMARRHDDRRDGQKDRCPNCGRSMPSGHRESGNAVRRGPGGRG